MNNSIYNKLVKKETTLALIGLGYVGLPIALEFARKIKVVGFDINAERVDMMKNNIDPSNELDASEFEGCDITFTANIDDLKEKNEQQVVVVLHDLRSEVRARRQWKEHTNEKTHIFV